MREPFNTLHLNISPEARQSERARVTMLAFFSRRSLGMTELDDFMIAVGEALANAIEHAGSATPISIDCLVDEEHIVAKISDNGRGIKHIPAKPHFPGPFAERGRGLAIMARCADIFHIDSRPGEGTCVTLGRRVTPAADTSKSA